jgi:hypothetical protein
MVGAVTVLTLGLAWFLERFQTEALMGEIRGYLGKVDNFRQWEREHGGGESE